MKAGTSEQVVWRARLVLGCLLLTALCFQRMPGPVATGGRLDDPGTVLRGALHLWDPSSALGHLQSQAFGYLWPIGPFQWLTRALSMPEWVGQRLWWSVVLCVAFLGVWKLANALRYGVPLTRFAVALLYGLSPLLIGAMSITSVQVWPLAMAPWVLLPLVTPRARSGWWRVGWSAVAFALIGGAEPVTAALTLVLPALWLLTRRWDRWTLKVAVGWLGCVAAVSVWWLVPLLLVTHYGTPADRDVALAKSAGETYDAVTVHWRSWIDRQDLPGNVLVVPAARPQWVDDELAGRLASGAGDQSLRQTLVNAGVRYVVVRSDLTALAPIAIHETLTETGLKRVASFPRTDIYDLGPANLARLIPESRLVEVRGTTDDVPAVLSALGGDREAITSADSGRGLRELPLIQVDGAASDRQPSALLFRSDADAQSGLLRSVELPQPASYELRGTVRSADVHNRAGAACGAGPVVRVDGVPIKTQVLAGAAESMTFTSCETGPVVLAAGRHDIEVLANGGFVPVEATLTKAGFGNVSVTPVQGINLWRPNPAGLTLEVPGSKEQSVLTVAQNYSAGWEAYDGRGRKLTPIRVAGWQQGWVLPAGEEQLVSARFMPDRSYRAGLLVGALGLVLVTGMAVFYRRRTRRSGHQLQAAQWRNSWLLRRLRSQPASR
ncbi:DUF3367 domain-containing protein [Kribbella sandramycini]|uniref:DUF3367 domain-containing protein n=1 Tax=Kribbella sandramycini TaxID=60450 RepID=A0A7Y4NXZ7_9ACTN|nr:DUF3367 domain-containing protein [Kribbella sandramycini]